MKHLKLKQIVLMVLIPLLLAIGSYFLLKVALAGEIEKVYFFANSKRVAISSGWSFTLALKPSQNFPANSTLTIRFPDNGDGYWCRTAGVLTVIPVDSSPVDISEGSWSVDTPLPGALTASCTKGSGGGSFDTITISGIGALVTSNTYGVNITGSSGVLGTHIIPTGHQISLLLENGVLNDSKDFILQLTDNTSVTVTASVLPAPECNVNSDCSYPVEICGALQQCMSCTSNAQCNSGDICVSGICKEDLSCNVNSDCDYPTEVCGANLQCQQCTLNSQCNPGDQCLNGACVSVPPIECTSNAQCNYPNQICNGANKCVSCTTNTQCNNGDQCVNGSCQPIPPFECTVNEQCDYPNEICDASNDCVECTVDWQCNNGEACVSGVCKEQFECLQNEDCAFPNQICNLESNVCEGCSFDAQCGGGNFCESGVCKAVPPAECTSNSQCGYPGEICVDGACTECTSNDQCTGSDICSGGACIPLPPLECTVNGHCNYPNEVCDLGRNLCITCTSSDQCNFGESCINSRCVYIPPAGEQPTGPKIPVGAKRLSDRVLENIGVDPEKVRKEVEKVAQLAPVAYTVNVVTTSAITAGLLNLTFAETPVLILRGIAGLLSLFGLRWKGEPYGYVYNAITKEPIANAIVRIFRKRKDGQTEIVRTAISDAFGVFDAQLEPGEYTLTVSRSGFKFPSSIVRGLADFPIDNVYRGGEFTVRQDAQLYYSIPIDPVKQSLKSKFGVFIRERAGVALKFIQLALLVFGAVFSLMLFIVIPIWFNLLMLLLYIPVVILSLISYRYTDPKMGRVKGVSGNPLEGIPVGLYDLGAKRFITKRVSDRDGEFRFVVPKGEYQLHLLDKDYEMVGQQLERSEQKNRDGTVMMIIADTLTVERKVSEEKTKV